MNNSFYLLTSFCLLFVWSCATTTKTSLQETKGRFDTALLAKDMAKEKGELYLVNITNTFSPDDLQAVMRVKIKDVSGRHTLRWEWYDPKGNLYYATGEYPINKDGRLRENSISWHKMFIKGEKASGLLGKWMVKVFLNNKHIVTKEFEIK